MSIALDRRERSLTLAAVSTGYFSVQIALAPISAIIPSLARALDADLATASWIVIGYLLALSAFLLLAGRLGDLMGHRTLFLAGGVLFTLAGQNATNSIYPNFSIFYYWSKSGKVMMR